MKLYYSGIRSILYFTFLLLPECCRSQEMIVYFIAPENAISGGFPGNFDRVNCPPGYAKAEITSSTVSLFRSVAPPNIKFVYEQLQPGTEVSSLLNHIFKNSNGKVTRIEYWLVDDRNSLSELTDDKDAGILTVYTTWVGKKKYVWPTAVNFESGSDFYTGRVILGETQLASEQTRRPEGKKIIKEVVLHESSHTQLLGKHKWDGFGDYAVTFGEYGVHLGRKELLADQESAFDEGLAKFYGYIMNDDGIKKLFENFTLGTPEYYLEIKSFLASQPGLKSAPIWLTIPLITIEENGTEKNLLYEDGTEILYHVYKWKDVPGWYLLFNESTPAFFFSIFRNNGYTDKELATSMIQLCVQEMSPVRKKRFLTYACNRLALKMEEHNNSERGAQRGDRISSLFPFAILDLLTHFGMTNDQYQADYNRNSADKDPLAYSEYFKRRDAIRRLVEADINSEPIRFKEALKKISDYCKQPGNIF